MFQKENFLFLIFCWNNIWMPNIAQDLKRVSGMQTSSCRESLTSSKITFSKNKKMIDKKVVDHFVEKTVVDVRGFSAWVVGVNLLGGGINQLIFWRSDLWIKIIFDVVILILFWRSEFRCSGPLSPF